MQYDLTLKQVMGDFSILKFSKNMLNNFINNADIFMLIFEENCISAIIKNNTITDLVDDIETGWRCFKVDGVLSFDMIGVLQVLLKPLVDIGVSVLANSSYDTDYIFVKACDVEKSCTVWRTHGFKVFINEHG